MTTTDDLNVSLARLMGYRESEDHGGWTQLAVGDEPRDRRQDATRLYRLPDWAGSLDALFAPGGPVEYANSKGLRVWLVVDGGAVARIMRNIWSKPIRVACADPAEALATALHEAFMKEQGQ